MALIRGTPAIRRASASGSADWWNEVKSTASSISAAAS